ncbi:hypothetical protein DM02DRAFT_207624 [Periconia macrospinosa]|uniref:Uncharacterized protein n=1 Tax=Periconia macrospinosa TaxID=97972 RepID=A0A2V1D7C6_9PLEO|nr:hypothetical protein DM02DRAFT_207624 [Periconia macrospinosa]
MESNEPSTSTAFNKLPIELNKRIAHFLLPDPDSSRQDILQADANIAKFSKICRATNHAIDGDNYSFWRAAFRERFALLPAKVNVELRTLYQRRAKYLRKGCSGLEFHYGTGSYEKRVLVVLMGLIQDSFRGQLILDNDGTSHCPNTIVLRDFIMHSRLVLHRKMTTHAKPQEAAATEPVLAAIRIMCTQLLFTMDNVGNRDVIGFPDSQKAVYASTHDAPIFTGPKENIINMKWVLHCFNFFRYYMATPEASALHDNLCYLGASQRPRPWDEPLKRGSYPLGNYWKGTYAFLEQSNLHKLRRHTAKRPGKAHDTIFDDLNIDEGKVQSLYLDFTSDPATQDPWPNLFEAKLRSKRDTLPTSPPQQPPQHSKNATPEYSTKNIQLKGWGEDLDDHFFATGWLNPLPPQSGIPGWQRVTFMKHFETDATQFSHDNLWAYEGVVLPGGKFIVGRWWYASDEVDMKNDYNGPFILWAVDEEPSLENSESEE